MAYFHQKQQSATSGPSSESTSAHLEHFDSPNRLKPMYRHDFKQKKQEDPKTEESPSKMDFQCREDPVRVLPRDPTLPTRAPPPPPAKPPTGRASRPSECGDKNPDHPAAARPYKPPLAPRPDKNKLKRMGHQPDAPINTEKPVSSECTPKSGIDSKMVGEQVHIYEHSLDFLLRLKPGHQLPGKLTTGGLAESPYADKRGYTADKEEIYQNKLRAMASDPEGSKLFKALEGMVLERKASKLADHNFALFDTPWRSVDWSAYQNMRDNLRMRQVSSPEVKCLRILVHGPVGAGKSSFVNSVASIFQERIVYAAAVDATSDFSFTRTFQTHYIQDCKFGCPLPFAICDIMGLENEDFAGLQIDDLIKVLQGHIKDGYKFKTKPCSKRSSLYLRNPSLHERIHCLVSVIPADKISFMEEAVIDKMRKVRIGAVDLKIPQMVVLTRVDLMCPAVAKDLKLIYRSKTIKKKMLECSNILGVPMNCIFPVKNYHEETDLIDEVNVLVLSALKHILDCANDHVINITRSLPQTDQKKSRSSLGLF